MMLRPGRPLVYTSFAGTVVAMVGLYAMFPDRGADFFYTARWDVHSSYYASCKGCHEPFRRVQDTSCLGCHTDYRPEHNPDTLVVYTGPPATDRAGRAADRGRRIVHAHLLYHRLPAIAAMECAACHPEHTPPPPPHGWAFVHKHGRHLPVGSANLAECRQCHSPHQAPPGEPHAVYTLAADAATDCSQCHTSTIDWRLDVEVADAARAATTSLLNRPAGDTP
jgi:hypothetical protein